MLVSIFADASFDHRLRIAGWGAWARSNRGVVRRGGIMRDKINDSSQAEAAAMVNGVYMAIKHRIAQTGDCILIQSDCMTALEQLQGKHRCRGAITLRAIEKLAEIKSEHKLSISFRHVKGHSNNETPRGAVNNICDRIARIHLQQARKEYS